MRIAIGILMAGIVATANADAIFSNLGPGDSFGMTSGWVVGNRTTPFGSFTLEVAVAFRSSGTRAWYPVLVHAP
jgi:hypothetical protein